MNFLLPHLLVNSARKYPDRDAVVFGSERLSYRRLDEITNRLAHVLKAHGVRRGDRVGIYINKSAPSVISIFGILKAGAVFVPLDPNAPEPRIAYIIDNCQVRVLLTSTAKSASVSTLSRSTTSLKVAVLTDEASAVDAIGSLAIIPWKSVEQHQDSSV